MPRADDLLHLVITVAALFAVLYALYVLGTSTAEYALDSVGFITSINDDLRTRSPLSAEQIDAGLEAIGAHTMVGLGPAFKSAENAYGINAVFLAAVAVHESNKGTSVIAVEKHNLMGWGALDLDPYDHAYTFQSSEKGIHHVAERLRSQYMDRRGLTTLAQVGGRYATDRQWPEKVLYWVTRIQEATSHD